MAKIKERTPMPNRDAKERSKDFEEVSLGYSQEEALKEAERCLQCKNPTCEQGCPVGINIKDFISHLKEKDLDKALAAIERSSSLPAVCGRVCPQEKQCEAKCILAKKHTPVAIGRLERFLGDYGSQKKQH